MAYTIFLRLKTKAYLLRLISLFLMLLPRWAPAHIYVSLSRLYPLRVLLNGIILSVIPYEVILEEGVLLLNKSDPVISGAVAFGVYEKEESKLFRSILKKGMTVIDVGANIGYYTLIAANRVGPGGHILAFEPEPESFSLLLKTIDKNRFSNVECFNMAVSNSVGDGKLFLSETNKGLHRIYSDEERRSSIPVLTTTLDEVLKNRAGNIDIIKMDIEGAEGMALEGMNSLLKNTSHIILLTEFWPVGLMKAGSSPQLFLSQIYGLGFSIYEINEKRGRLEEVQNFTAFIKKNYGRKKYTNLYCKK